MSERSKKIGWSTAIAALIGVGLIVGLTLGVLGSVLGVSSWVAAIVVGLICGVTAPFLVSRMRATC